MRILHVTESMAGGVMISLAELARAQSRDGHDVSVLHSRRPDTPSADLIGQLLPEPIVRREIQNDARRVIGFIALMAGIGRELMRVKPDVIHLHSSYAGLAGRVTAFAMGAAHRTVYSPHGFAFLNADALILRRIAVMAEKLLCRLGGKLALVSASEMGQAKDRLGARRTYLLLNRVDIGKLPARIPGNVGSSLTIGTVARISYAKAPWKLAEIARRAPKNLRFVWIGDGDGEDKSRWLQGCGMAVTGWLSPECATARASELDIYISTSLWEGMPLAVLEAQALGIPCIVSSVGGNVDAIEHNVTGFACSSLPEYLSAIQLLTEDANLRKAMGAAAARRAQQKFSVDTLSADSIAIYLD